MAIEDGIPRGSCGLNEFTALHGMTRCGRHAHLAFQLAAHALGEVAAVLLIGAKDFDLLETKQAAQILQVRPGLPSAAEQSEYARLRRGQVLRSNSAEGRDAKLLNDAVRHNRNRLDPLDVEKHHKTAIPIAGRNREYPASFDAGGERVSRHVGGNSQRPDSGAGTATLLR